MASEPKTRPTDVPVADFIAAVENPRRRADAEVVQALMAEASGEPAVTAANDASSASAGMARKTAAMPSSTPCSSGVRMSAMSSQPLRMCRLPNSMLESTQARSTAMVT